MGEACKFTPASSWRAFFVWILVIGSAFAGPDGGAPTPPLAQLGKPDAAESAKILDQFRHSGWFGYIEFDLHARPRRGDETVYHGRLWGAHNEQGSITRIEVTDGKGQVHRVLLQNGERASVWRFESNEVAQVAGGSLLDPIISGVDVTAFDLQMPYLYWPDPKVESIVRIRGRPAYDFVFIPPSEFSSKYPQIGSVHAFFDAQYNAPMQIELTNDRRVTKTTTLNDLKKVGEQWIPKSFDIRDEISRDKTRFEVTAAALNLEFGAAVFAPASLADSVPPPAPDRIVHLDQ